MKKGSVPLPLRDAEEEKNKNKKPWDKEPSLYINKLSQVEKFIYLERVQGVLKV